MVNHFENHTEITTKDNLFKNLKAYNESEISECVPLTFLIESHSETFAEDLDKFKSVFKILKDYSEHAVEGEEHKIIVDEINEKINDLQNFKARGNKNNGQMKMPYSHFDGYNIWFLKVTQYNRGRGIYVFNDIDKMIALIKELKSGIILSNNTEIEAPTTDHSREKGPQSFSNIQAVPNKIKSSNFVIQKYIERPLLINKRKFDVRVWVLVTQENKVYFYKEGYLRTS